MITRRTFFTATATATATAALAASSAPALAAPDGPAPAGPAPGRPPQPSAPRGRERLTNLAHLRFLLAEVPLPAVEGHTTSEQEADPRAVAPWTYAEHREDGTFERVGGGTVDPATGYWTQGAYNADDIARAAIVFLRAFRTFGDPADRDTARDLLRTLTYLQVDSGPFAGNVVLWMQVDGTLNRSAIPVELPDPSDSDESYWLARTVWALGEAAPVFADEDPDFARFLTDRLHLALDALERASLGRYGTWQVADGTPVPGWLITGGADATGEAVLGLVEHVRAHPRDRRVRRALRRYSEGLAAMASGGVARWPFGAILPWTGSQSLWHAWGGLAPAALAAVSEVTGLGLEAAVGDAGVFTPQLLTAGGPYNAWSPVPGEAQIAYGAQSRVESLLRTAEATGGEGLAELAALAAGWFFGANPSARATYDPTTGVTIDGVEPDGRVNLNSGAESTIHGLLAMIALDANRDVARLARRLTGPAQTSGMRWLPAEGAQLSGGARVITPPSAWTGESNWRGAFVEAAPGGVVRFELDADQRAVVDAGGATAHPLIHRLAAEAGTSRWTAIDRRGRRTPLGSLALGGAGERGTTEWDGLLRPFPLDRDVPAGTRAIEVLSDGNLELDELMLLPAITTAVYPARRGSSIILRAASVTARADIRPGERGTAYSADGQRVGRVTRGRRTLGAGTFSITRQ